MECIWRSSRQCCYVAANRGGDGEPNGQTRNQTAGDLYPAESSAYAKISFADGDFLVTTHECNAWTEYGGCQEPEAQEEGGETAREAMSSYRKEPSRTIQHEDGDQQANPSSSNQSLEGRPAPPSNVSERGGEVSDQTLSSGQIEHATNTTTKAPSLRLQVTSTTSIDPAMIRVA